MSALPLTFSPNASAPRRSRHFPKHYFVCFIPLSSILHPTPVHTLHFFLFLSSVWLRSIRRRLLVIQHRNTTILPWFFLSFFFPFYYVSLPANMGLFRREWSRSWLCIWDGYGCYGDGWNASGLGTYPTQEKKNDFFFPFFFLYLIPLSFFFFLFPLLSEEVFGHIACKGFGGWIPQTKLPWFRSHKPSNPRLLKSGRLL